MPKIELLSTDLDGTLIEFSLYNHCIEELADWLLAYKQGGGLWVMNTGRSFLQTLDGLEQFGGPILPDYLITLEREIYHLSPSGEWKDFGDWNLLCKQRHQEIFAQYEDGLKTVCQKLFDEQEITLLYEEEKEGSNLTGLMASSESVMERATLEIDRVCKDFPGYAYQRNTVYLRFCHKDYHKGAALGELCRLIHIRRDSVFAVGDNFNDISMLDGTYAAMCACPANAVEPVKKTVLRANGFVASKDYAHGVVEAVEHFGSRVY